MEHNTVNYLLFSKNKILKTPPQMLVLRGCPFYDRWIGYTIAAAPSCRMSRRCGG